MRECDIVSSAPDKWHARIASACLEHFESFKRSQSTPRFNEFDSIAQPKSSHIHLLIVGEKSKVRQSPMQQSSYRACDLATRRSPVSRRHQVIALDPDRLNGRITLQQSFLARTQSLRGRAFKIADESQSKIQYLARRNFLLLTSLLGISLQFQKPASAYLVEEAVTDRVFQLAGMVLLSGLSTCHISCWLL